MGIEFKLIAIGATFGVIAAVLLNQANADCFEQAKTSVNPQVELRLKIHRTDFGCGSNFSCLLKEVPGGFKRLNVVVGRKQKNRVTFGNGGWAKSLATARTSNTARIRVSRKLQALVNNAMEISLGVELDSLINGPQHIQGDKEFHNFIAQENNCINRKHPGRVGSFNELVKIPKVDWVSLRREQGWI